MRIDWEQDELISAWTLVEGDWDLVGEKAGAGRLGFALILKFYEIEGRFPAYPEEIPAAAVEYVASLVKVETELLAKYSWRSRTIERHRAQIRKRFGTARRPRTMRSGWPSDWPTRCARSRRIVIAWPRRCGSGAGV
ncbi:DUF4158 domain-containing protein [Nonomuraea sp. NPDC049028]|uniref:DUF4158 domain-containing protein n=1 Tax=Nonomuraea sp. NPDC049028 TaxID=3364348 RepID=UPI00371868EA